jgi:HlyD family secretion protein
MMKKKKWWWIAGIALVILMLYISQKTKSKDVLVAVEEVKSGNIVEKVSASGVIQPEVEVKISPEVPGEILEIYVREGDAVEKGQLLVKINPDLLISSVERNEAQANNARANLSNAKARLLQSKAQFINADKSYERSTKLWKDKAISDSEYDQANASYEVAKAEVQAAEESVKAAQFMVSSAEAGYREAKNNLLRTTIFAPMDGTVSSLTVEKGERVVGTQQMAGTEIMRIANLQNMEVKVQVNESDIVKVSVGDSAEIEVDAYPDVRFKGIVTQVANSTKSAQSGGGLNQSVSADQATSFEVKISLLRSSYKHLIKENQAHLSPFKPGMSATVDISTNKIFDVIKVPIQSIALRETEDENDKDNKELKECVFIVDGDKAKRVFVKTGIQDNQYIHLVSGVAVGDKVIIAPFSAISKGLSDNTAIKVVSKEELFLFTEN